MGLGFRRCVLAASLLGFAATASYAVPKTESPEDYLPLKPGTTLRYRMGKGPDAAEWVDRITESKEGPGSYDVSILRKGPLLDTITSNRVYRADHDLRKLMLESMASVTGATDCEISPEVLLAFPLEIGKTWKTTECSSMNEETTAMANSALGENLEPGHRYTQLTVAVIGRKTVGVEAGQFDTWVLRKKEVGSSGKAKVTWEYYAKKVGLVLQEILDDNKKKIRGFELAQIEYPDNSSEAQEESGARQSPVVPDQSTSERFSRCMNTMGGTTTTYQAYKQVVAQCPDGSCMPPELAADAAGCEKIMGDCQSKKDYENCFGEQRDRMMKQEAGAQLAP